MERHILVYMIDRVQGKAKCTLLKQYCRCPVHLPHPTRHTLVVHRYSRIYINKFFFSYLYGLGLEGLDNIYMLIIRVTPILMCEKQSE